eukprot:TRINITY_DN4579_c0_g1_i1.p1 TRINITY_DN4579_c0_g1~~TRINITY_DN4579_c0_g1_i1.p1  ORF type:complete len:961 (-),score=176.25 TRINITY_DN4579_c0_g1_i1:2122-5004(-)
MPGLSFNDYHAQSAHHRNSPNRLPQPAGFARHAPSPQPLRGRPLTATPSPSTQQPTLSKQPERANPVTENNDLVLPTSAEYLFPAANIKQYAQHDKAETLGCGLVNLGNTCYMNAVLQCLFHTGPLIAFLADDAWHDHTGCTATADGKKRCPFCSFCSHFRSAQTMVRGAPGVFYQYVLDTIAPAFLMYQQQDAHEFLRLLLEHFHTQFSQKHRGGGRIEDTTVIHQMFGGYYQSQTTCANCRHPSNVYDAYLDLNVEIQDAHTLQEALALTTKRERLTADNLYKCGRCKQQSQALRRLAIHTLPPVLNITLKRFRYAMGYYGMHGSKVTKHVPFPEYLNMRPYLTASSAETQTVYRLYAVLVHAGSSAHSGHYYSFVRVAEKWFRMDDDDRAEVRLPSVLASNAYMLFYVRTNDVSAPVTQAPASDACGPAPRAPQPPANTVHPTTTVPSAAASSPSHSTKRSLFGPASGFSSSTPRSQTIVRSDVPTTTTTTTTTAGPSPAKAAAVVKPSQPKPAAPKDDTALPKQLGKTTSIRPRFGKLGVSQRQSQISEHMRRTSASQNQDKENEQKPEEDSQGPLAAPDVQQFYGQLVFSAAASAAPVASNALSALADYNSDDGSTTEEELDSVLTIGEAPLPSAPLQDSFAMGLQSHLDDGDALSSLAEPLPDSTSYSDDLSTERFFRDTGQSFAGSSYRPGVFLDSQSAVNDIDDIISGSDDITGSSGFGYEMQQRLDIASINQANDDETFASVCATASDQCDDDNERFFLEEPQLDLSAQPGQSPELEPMFLEQPTIAPSLISGERLIEKMESIATGGVDESRMQSWINTPTSSPEPQQQQPQQHQSRHSAARKRSHDDTLQRETERWIASELPDDNVTQNQDVQSFEEGGYTHSLLTESKRLCIEPAVLPPPPSATETLTDVSDVSVRGPEPAAPAVSADTLRFVPRALYVKNVAIRFDAD